MRNEECDLCFRLLTRTGLLNTNWDNWAACLISHLIKLNVTIDYTSHVPRLFINLAFGQTRVARLVRSRKGARKVPHRAQSALISLTIQRSIDIHLSWL